MADHTIRAGQTGVYEVALTAGTTSTVLIKTLGRFTYVTAQVTVHDSTAPVYAAVDTTVAPRDPDAVVVPPGTWVDLPLPVGEDATIALVSVAAATVSVALT